MGFGSHTFALVLQAISLAFLILATITAPVVTSLYLSNDGEYKYGALGYCKSDGGSCSSAMANYDPSALTKSDDWKMSGDSRDKLAMILIVAPIAAGLTLLALLFSLITHVGRLQGSRVYCGFGLFFSILSFLATALICIVTMLCFYPHLGFVAWLLIPASVLTLLAVILTGFTLASSSSKNDFGTFEKEEESESLNSSTNQFTNKALDSNFVVRSYTQPSDVSSNIPKLPAGFKVTQPGSFKSNGNGSTFNSASSPFANPNNNTVSHNNSLTNQGKPQEYGNRSQVITGDYNKADAMGARQGPNIGNDYDNSGLDGDQQQAYDVTNMYKPVYNQQASSSYSSLNKPTTTSTKAYPLSSSSIFNPNDLKVPNIPNPYEEKSIIDGYVDIDDIDDDLGDEDDGLNFTGSAIDNKNYNQENEGKSGYSKTPSDAGSTSVQSDFTSISQREVNPKYYRGAPQKTVLPGQYNPMGNYQPSPNVAPLQPQPQPYQQPQYLTQQQQQQHSSYGSGIQQSYPNSSAYYPSTFTPDQAVNQRPYFPSNGYNQMAAAPQPRRPSNNKADILLNSNPEFSIGGVPGRPTNPILGGTRPGARKYGLQALTHQQLLQQNDVPQYSGYGGYKNKTNVNANANMPPSSMNRDGGPYGGMY